jgi:dihydroneopterin aldolase
VYEQERLRPQPFVVDLDLRLDVGPAGARDDLRETCDYGAAARIAAEVVAGPPRRLIEALATEIAQRLVSAFPRLREVRVAVHKPEAPVGLPLADVSVEVWRAR